MNSAKIGGKTESKFIVRPGCQNGEIMYVSRKQEPKELRG